MWSTFIQWFSDIITLIYGITVQIGVPSYGLAIIIMTVLIKLVMFPLTQQQMRSMRAMQDIQPKTKYIQEKYKDDPQLMQQKIMEMYKEHGVNPMGGCLPLLIQMPIFIAFYQSLILMSKTVFSTAQNPGFLWIQNIGILVKDDPNLLVFPFLPLILPILSAATTYFQQRISMVDNNEPTQKAMLYFMPVMMAYITYTVPGGLGLYWVVFNILGILQQLYVNRIHVSQKADSGTGTETEVAQLVEQEKKEPVVRMDKGGKEKNAGPNSRKKGKKR